MKDDDRSDGGTTPKGLPPVTPRFSFDAGQDVLDVLKLNSRDSKKRKHHDDEDVVEGDEGDEDDEEWEKIEIDEVDSEGSQDAKEHEKEDPEDEEDDLHEARGGLDGGRCRKRSCEWSLFNKLCQEEDLQKVWVPPQPPVEASTQTSTGLAIPTTLTSTRPRRPRRESRMERRAYPPQLPFGFRKVGFLYGGGPQAFRLPDYTKEELFVFMSPFTTSKEESWKDEEERVYRRWAQNKLYAFRAKLRVESVEPVAGLVNNMEEVQARFAEFRRMREVG